VVAERREVAARPADPEPDGDNPPDELLDAAADAAPLGDDGFESFAPGAAPAAGAHADGASDVAAPSVASAAARLPASTHRMLDELFKAKITSVRRISRDQLR